MIQLQKTTTAPASLATKNKYDGEDVKALLAKDHYDKCYICERQLTTDFQVEHLHSQEHYPDEKYNWENLFFACSYCNGRKSANFDGIVNPTKEAIEEKIVQTLNYDKADFATDDTSEAIQQTIVLLNRIFNGKNAIRKVKEERFFEEFLSKMNNFEKELKNYFYDKGYGNESEKEAADMTAFLKSLINKKLEAIENAAENIMDDLFTFRNSLFSENDN